MRLTDMSDAWHRSLSARRAWIEIRAAFDQVQKLGVSLSARRAWIEILLIYNIVLSARSRSPQGERG